MPASDVENGLRESLEDGDNDPDIEPVQRRKGRSPIEWAVIATACVAAGLTTLMLLLLLASALGLIGMAPGGIK
jgi:hypothetical protein